MKQKFFSIGDDYTIQDAAGEDAFYVDGRAFSIGQKLSFQDMRGNELAFIEQKLLSWGPTYQIYRGGQLAATVKKHLFTPLHAKFDVDVPGPDDLEATGDFFNMEYNFTRAGSPVATVSKRWFAMTDTYGVDVPDGGEDPILILAAAVVIDLCCHPDGKRQ